MKKLSYLFLFIILILTGCSDKKGSSNPLGIIDDGGGNGNTGNVTIQVLGQQEQDGYYFYIKPSVPVHLNNVTASVAAAAYEQTVEIEEDFNADNFQSVLKYENGPQTGQQWKFVFKGTTADNKAFTVTVNYTIP